MARRASSSHNPLILVIGAVLLVALIIGGKSLLGEKSVSFGNVSKLDMSEFLADGNSLRGSEYSLEGSIDEKLQWTTDRGQLISLRVAQPGGDVFLPIQIPPGVANMNLEMHQKYAFRVKIEQSGIAIATGVERL